jgi:hypothetical protein
MYASRMAGQVTSYEVDVCGMSMGDFLSMLTDSCGQSAADAFAAGWAMRNI